MILTEEIVSDIAAIIVCGGLGLTLMEVEWRMYASFN